MENGGSVYIIANEAQSVLYVSVCSNLRQRVNEHREKVYPDSFTAKHECSKLVYYENFESIKEAIEREKELSSKSDDEKIELIEKANAVWRDLSEEIKE